MIHNDTIKKIMKLDSYLTENPGAYRIEIDEKGHKSTLILDVKGGKQLMDKLINMEFDLTDRCIIYKPIQEADNPSQITGVFE